MIYNQFSYIRLTNMDALLELESVGFHFSQKDNAKKSFEEFIRTFYFHYSDTDYPLSLILANQEMDALTFFQSNEEITEEIFYTFVLQLLEFIPNIDFTDYKVFVNQIKLPVKYDLENIFSALHHTLSSRTKSGVLLVDKLVSQGLLSVDNNFKVFDGKLLASFDTCSLIREVVYIETLLDSDQDGELDLVKVNIIRPNTKEKVPAMMTASPYHNGTNDKASDASLHNMNTSLTEKDSKTISVETKEIIEYPEHHSTHPISSAEETFSHTWTYPLNDYFLARGFASLYVAGIGTAWSDGFMTSGDYQQVESFKAVIDWLNGRRPAYTSHKRDKQVLADWANGKVATTGKSYLGTMSTALATTGVEGLEVVIAEAGISSWYDYYRENGLVRSPGGYPGEDLDSLTELTYSRNLWAGDALNHNAHYQELLKEQASALDRETGDYNQFWHDRNYLPHLENVRAEMVYVHGLQDWNVTPRQVYNVLNQIPAHIKTHTFLHQGEHVYIHNWQSIDFKESMNALLTEKLLDQPHRLELPKLIWQNNQNEQTWQTLNQFGQADYQSFSLGNNEKIIENHYPREQFNSYSKNFRSFKSDLFTGKAQAITIDLSIDKDIILNGSPRLDLRIKSSHSIGILSAQLLDYGKKKRHTDLPRILELKAIDNGIHFSEEDLKELPFIQTDYRVISKGHLNLQNREDLLTISKIEPDQWMDIQLVLEPTIHELKTGDTIRLVLYTTDFEHTVRDNLDYQLIIDLQNSSLNLPH